MKNIYLINLEKRIEDNQKENKKYFLKLNEVKNIIKDIVKKYDVEKIVMFGSALNEEKFNSKSDLDIGIIGLKKQEDFFKLYRDLDINLDFKIDLFDLDDDENFKKIVLQKCEVLYENI
ncbi:MAG TPA: nucleotidyltransferase domain-containing protein [bacterium]|nr:nucleotidyltransferase domain-containing protein [bacterium]HOL47815.1 nucleotidyltransferase domain-containing protein [bacterium]HOL47819.1 nucleotidyltransferase domain-containing protein [bacterium]HPQ19945.1 nucleotidyltransferase domain-containing protein [bacterium]